MRDRITVGTKVLLDIMYYGGYLVTLTVPFSIHIYGKYFDMYFEKHYVPLCVLFFLSGILAILIIRELRKMFRSVLEDNCFVRENVDSLRKMGTYSFAIAFLTVFRIFIYFTPAVFIIILVFVVAGLFSKVLSQVFDRAITYKEENDLTV